MWLCLVMISTHVVYTFLHIWITKLLWLFLVFIGKEKKMKLRNNKVKFYYHVDALLM